MRVRLIAFMTFFMVTPVNAGLDQELDRMFEGMSNATQPSAQMGQRRGVLSAGSLVIRNRVMQAHPVTMTPPSLGGGCGGIDLYGGSFSFINQSQFMGLLRSIAANAGGYAFQLGINAMCPDCGSLMSDLQKKVQSLNEHFANSCQLAQGIVNDSVSALDAQQQARLSQISLSKGVGDVFQSYTDASGDPVERTQRQDPEGFRKRITGNLIWRALHQGQSTMWIVGADDALMEAIMSVTGSIIVSPPIENSTHQGVSLPLSRLPPLIGIRELMNGGQNPPTQNATLKMYQCDTYDPDGCLSPHPVDLTMQGIKTRVDLLLGGVDGTGGILLKFATGQGTFTPQEIGFMEQAPQSMGALIRNLAREDPSLARMFAQEAGPILATEIAGDLIEDMVETVRESSWVADHPYQSRVQIALAETLSRIREERHALERHFGTTATLVTHYQALMQTGRSRDYGVGGSLPGGARKSPS